MMLYLIRYLSDAKGTCLDIQYANSPEMALEKHMTIFPKSFRVIVRKIG